MDHDPGRPVRHVPDRDPIGCSDGGPSLIEASTTVAVAAASLSAAYNNTGISDNADESAADYDGSGDSFSAQALAAATERGGWAG